MTRILSRDPSKRIWGGSRPSRGPINPGRPSAEISIAGPARPIMASPAAQRLGPDGLTFPKWKTPPSYRSFVLKEAR
jgi:hypothetical protein